MSGSRKCEVRRRGSDVELSRKIPGENKHTCATGKFPKNEDPPVSTTFDASVRQTENNAN